jgi:hypothetical protein
MIASPSILSTRYRLAGQPRFVCNVLRNITITHLMMGDLNMAQVELCEGLSQGLGGDYQKSNWQPAQAEFLDARQRG